MTACKTRLYRALPKPVVLALLAVAASAASTSVIGQEKPVHARLSVASFSWFQNAPEYAVANADTQQTSVVIFGNNEYICSPAGFGQHSHCYSR